MPCGWLVLDGPLAHNQLAEVFMLITNEVCVIQNRALLESMVMEMWISINCFAHKTGFVKIIWIVLDCIHCSMTSTLNVVIVRKEFVVVIRVVCVVIS